MTHRLSDGARVILGGFGAAGFDALIGLELLRRPKPAPDPIRQALDLPGVAPDHAAAVWNTPDDMHAACAARVLAVRLPTGSDPAAVLHASDAKNVVSMQGELPVALTRIGG